MQPIVDGLRSEFGAQMAFEERDANSESGSASLRAFGLRAHPSYAIVDAKGNLLWSATGPMSLETLRERIRQHINVEHRE
jgi:hypothetical protein